MTQEQQAAEQQAAEEAMQAQTDSPENQAGSESDDDLAEQLAEAQGKVKEYWDQIVRLNAEIDNNRKRAQRDVENAHKFAVKNFVESLLPIADSMELGLNAANADNVNIDSIKQGIEMTHELFVKTMEKNGIEVVDPKGEKFDPELHQAMSMVETDEVEPNTVLDVMQKGYTLNDRLIRPAMVVVSKAQS
jgi:molecular chaperone GrpE